MIVLAGEEFIWYSLLKKDMAKIQNFIVTIIITQKSAYFSADFDDAGKGLMGFKVTVLSWVRSCGQFI